MRGCSLREPFLLMLCLFFAACTEPLRIQDRRWVPPHPDAQSEETGWVPLDVGERESDRGGGEASGESVPEPDESGPWDAAEHDDASHGMDASTGTDALDGPDATSTIDASARSDASAALDASNGMDASARMDAAVRPDAHFVMDAGMAWDAGVSRDAGTAQDAASDAASMSWDASTAPDASVAVDSSPGDAGASDRGFAQICDMIPTVALSGTRAGTTVGAFNRHSASCATTDSPDAFFKLWVPVRLASLFVDTRGTSFDTVLSLYRGCENATLLVCNDDDLGQSSSLIGLSAVEPGEYTVVVEGFDTLAGDFTLNVISIPENCARDPRSCPCAADTDCLGTNAYCANVAMDGSLVRCNVSGSCFCTTTCVFGDPARGCGWNQRCEFSGLETNLPGRGFCLNQTGGARQDEACSRTFDAYGRVLRDSCEVGLRCRESTPAAPNAECAQLCDPTQADVCRALGNHVCEPLAPRSDVGFCLSSRP